MKRAKLLLQKFPQSATDFVFFTDEKIFSFASPDNRQNKVSGRLQELLKKRLSIFFSAGTVRSATAWPPFNCACVPQLDNSLLTPRFVQLFSENYYSVNLFAVYPFKYKLFLSKSCPRRWIPCLLLNVDKHCKDVCCNGFLVPQIDRKTKQVKEHWHEKFYLQSVWRKTQYVKHRKYQNLWTNNKVTGD